MQLNVGKSTIFCILRVIAYVHFEALVLSFSQSLFEPKLMNKKHKNCLYFDVLTMQSILQRLCFENNTREQST